MAIWEYLLLFFSVIGGGLIALRTGHLKRDTLKLLLSFSGAYVLGIAVLHLLPEVFTPHDGHRMGLWILGGFLIQQLLEPLSRGVEHGHVHAHHTPTFLFGAQILLGLCLHSFVEGLPLSAYPHLQHHASEEGPVINHLLFGIILHKIPAAFALGVLLLRSGYSRLFLFVSLFIFAGMSPLGAFLGANLSIDDQLLRVLMAIVVGSFLHIATTILFEAENNRQHTLSWIKLLVVTAGIGAAILTLFV